MDPPILKIVRSADPQFHFTINSKNIEGPVISTGT